ncbi:lysylphosphatidylglycerol synthase transmembrane domain-containing protein [Puniceibacterium confluentis]|uniref:lysylphosphatidylglycerol synthase transmembrane domain-containing protein n=1 Tax=Puniceibacterium confluentis TaxID=1958944 RepID=UPI00356836E5
MPGALDRPCRGWLAMMRPVPRLGKRAFRAAQILVSIALLAVLWNAVGGAEALGSLMRAKADWLLLAYVALTLQTVLSGLRWKLTAQGLGQRFTSGQAVREYYLAQFVNQSLPGGMVGDAGRALRARHQAGLMRASQGVVFERLSGQVAVFAVMALAFLVTSLAPGGLDWPLWVRSFVVPLILFGLAAPVVFWLGGLLPGPQSRALDSLWAALHAALLAPRVLGWQILLGLATTACTLSAFAFCARATGTDLSLAEILGIVPLILFTMLIPVSVSGWGLREGAAAALFPVAGASAASGLAASIAFGLVFIAVVLPGVLPLLQGRRKSP